MKFWLNLFAFAAVGHLTLALGPNMICYYDASSEDRVGVSKFSIPDLETAVQFCTHLVYGYAGINAETFELISLNAQRDLQRRHLATVTALRDRFPNTKFLLGLGGDKDLQNPEKYINLLEAGREKQSKFVNSAREFLRLYNFDGLDLAFQFPRNKPRKVHSDVGSAWKSFKKLFTGDYVVDEKAGEHREQFSELVKDLKAAFVPYNMMLSLTVLPNVNSSWYFNVPAISNHLDHVTLATFDFTTPDRNPEEADYTAPLYPPILEGNRLPHYNVDFQVDHWISQGVPHNKINIGVASYGRAWKMTSDSKTDGFPIVSNTDGPAPAGYESKTPGLLTWPEVCHKLPNPTNVAKTGAEAPIRRVNDPNKKVGVYAFRPANADGEHGIWVSYDDPDVASNKASFVRNRGLGGVALFDLTMDDFRGTCTGDKFPMLRAIKYKLL
ncbi:chitinase-like protein Idgf3 isoform X2 [Stomoxys calcitrans]|uniref:GH18 domain-containing protein n=1 Tax=Stomoxys calcitrans TaxID=35570 RepID=A0A1I8NN38_STOCA|nr:chitinase-like protein Idgf3 isoform X2 [Stomoxys calcitrans]